MNKVSLQVNANTAGRPPVKQEGLIDDLRGKIINGTYAPGERLPSVRALEKDYDASRATIQRVLDTIREDGFIVTQVGSGTRVSPHPPHLCRYGLVVPGHPKHSDWTNYYETIRAAARTVANERPGGELVLYAGITGPMVHRSYADLLCDVESRRCAGLIFAVPPFMLQESPVILRSGMPRVVIGLPEIWKNCSCIAPKSRALAMRAMKRFGDAGCKRLAVMMPASTTLSFEEQWREFSKLAKAQKLNLRKHCLQGVDLHTPEWTQNLARLLFHESRDERPDALLIVDDNLTQAVTAGVKAAGVKAPDDLLIISHANFPNLPDPALPVTWLGFDLVEMMREAMRLIDAQRRVGADPQKVEVKPVFEDERPAVD